MFRNFLIIVAYSQCLLGCANLATPQNRPGSAYGSQHSGNDGATAMPQCHSASVPTELLPDRYVPPAVLQGTSAQLAIGDRLRLAISGDKDLLSGAYIVGSDGMLQLPQLRPLRAAGRDIIDIQRELEQNLIDLRLIRPLSNGVRLHMVEQAPVPVSVAGAVFEPGTVRIGERSPEVRNVNLGSAVSGDLNPGRMLSTALRAAGGIRPDADAGGIYIKRLDHMVADRHERGGGRILCQRPAVDCWRQNIGRVGRLSATRTGAPQPGNRAGDTRVSFEPVASGDAQCRFKHQQGNHQPAVWHTDAAGAGYRQLRGWIGDECGPVCGVNFAQPDQWPIHRCFTLHRTYGTRGQSRRHRSLSDARRCDCLLR